MHSLNHRGQELKKQTKKNPQQFAVYDSDIPLQWKAVDAEIKVPSVANTELKGSPFKAWSRSVYSYACYTYCQGVFPC